MFQHFFKLYLKFGQQKSVIGYEVVIVDNFSNSKPEALNRIKKITGKDFAFYEADLLDLAALEKIFEENKIDAVVFMIP